MQTKAEARRKARMPVRITKDQTQAEGFYRVRHRAYGDTVAEMQLVDGEPTWELPGVLYPVEERDLEIGERVK